MKQFSLPDVDSIDEVPDEYKAFYFLEEGKVKRQKPDMMSSTLAKVKRENDRLAAEVLEKTNALALYKDVLGDDADPDRIKILKDKAAKADSLQTDEDVEKRIATVKAAADRDLEKARAVIKMRESTIEQYAVTTAIRDALKQVDANDDALELLPAKMRERLKVEFGDKDIVVTVLDKDGSKKIRENGEDASLLDLANEFKGERSKLFNGTTQSGAGQSPQEFQLPSGQKSYWKMNDIERSAYLAKNGKENTQAFMAASPQ